MQDAGNAHAAGHFWCAAMYRGDKNNVPGPLPFLARREEEKTHLESLSSSLALSLACGPEPDGCWCCLPTPHPPEAP